MKIKGTQDSHIQVPKSLLKGFSTKAFKINELNKKENPNIVYKLDMNCNITQVKINDENTEFGYYEDDIETKLGSIENAFGLLKKRILNGLKLKNKLIEFKENDVLTIKKFCSICLIRSQLFVSEVKDKSLFIDYYENAPQNVIVYKYLKSPEFVDKFIVGKNISFVINETKINYVLPRFYAIGIKTNNDVSDFFIPISPKVLLRLTTVKTINENTFYFGRMEEADVDNLNKIAIQNEFRNNKGAIYAQNEEDLKRYIPFLKELKSASKNH